MIISCQNCTKKYRIDPQKLNGRAAKFTCKTCGEIVTVNPDEGLVGRNELQGAAASIPFTSSENTKSPAQWSQEAENQSQFRRQSTKADFKKFRKDKKRWFGLTAKVTLFMLFVSLVPLLIHWYLSYDQIENRIREDTEVNLNNIATGLTNHVDEWIDKNVRILDALANMPDIISMDRKRQEPLLKIVQQAYPWMYLVFTIGADGMNVARNDGKKLKDYHDRLYVIGALKGNRISWQTIISRTNFKPAVVLSVPIRDEGRIVGVMAVGVNIDTMSKQIATWKRGKTGFAFMVDDTDKVVAHQINKFVTDKVKLDKHPLIREYKKGNKKPIYFSNEKKEPCVGVVKETEYGWLLCVQQNKSEIFQILENERLFAYIILASTVIAVLLFAWLAGRMITKPIKDITKAADLISIGDLDVPINQNSKDEIGDLAGAIVRMQESIRLSLQRLRRRGRAA